MEKRFSPTGETPEILIEVHGNLRLRGSEEAEVIAKADSSEDLSVEGEGDRLTIRCKSDCTVITPYTSNLIVQVVHGEASIKALEGNLVIDMVHGNLDLRNVGVTRLTGVHGNLTAKHIDGDFQIGRVEGNATIRDVLGNFIVSESVNGNLNLNDVEGDASATADGNITLRIDPLPGQSYDFKASGNVMCRLPPDASVKLDIWSGNKTTVDLPGMERKEKGGSSLVFTLGDGDASIKLHADGNTLVSSWTPEWEFADDFGEDFVSDFEGMAEDIGQQVARQIETQMEMLEHHLGEHLGRLSSSLGAAGISPDEAERIKQRAREASERATARAQEKMQRAHEQMQRKMEAARRRAEHKVHAAHRRHAGHDRRGWSFQWPSGKSETAGDPVTDQERLLILKMLEEKKISLIEAEQLLEALEGKEA
jgi:hypothetical protein